MGDSKFGLYFPLTIIAGCFIYFTLMLFGCTGNNTTSQPKRTYLGADSTIYTKGDTLTIDNRKFIKVYGVTHCKYGCPVLIECK